MIGFVQQRIDIIGGNVESIAHAMHVPSREEIGYFHRSVPRFLPGQTPF